RVAEFEERRRLGLGYFADEKQIEKYGTMDAVFMQFPSVRSRRVRGGGLVITLPGGDLTRGAQGCSAQIWIDGFRADAEQLATLDVSNVAGIEVYVRASDVPLRYQTVSPGCGAVFVWTAWAFDRPL